MNSCWIALPAACRHWAVCSATDIPDRLKGEIQSRVVVGLDLVT